MKSKLVLGLFLLFSGTLVTVSLAQNGPQTPEQQAEKAVKTRQGLFEVQGFAFGPVGAMLKDAPYDAAVAQKAAARIQVTASMISEVFQFDTRKFSVTSKAKDTVWTEQQAFSQKAQDLQKAAAELQATAAKGDRTATLTAANKVGQACKSCHEDYRAK